MHPFTQSSLLSFKTARPLQTCDAATVVERFETYLQSLRYSPSTISSYTTMISGFLGYVQKPIPDMVMEDIHRYNQCCIIGRGYSVSYQRQVVSALKLLFTHIQQPQFEVEELQRPHKEKKLPIVLSKDEVRKLLTHVRHLKHKAILSTLYSSGLRIGELLRLRVRDIDSDRMLVRVCQSKGRKDRYAILSEANLLLLRTYYARFKPSIYLFEGIYERPYSATSVRNILRRACTRAGIRKRVTPHTLRHSYATHMLELGVDLRYVQALLGHARPETTMIYTHISTQKLQDLANPLDQLWQEEITRDKRHAFSQKPVLIPEKSWGYG